MSRNLEQKRYEWEREREPGFRRTKRINGDDTAKLHPNDVFDKNKFVFEKNKGIVGWGKW